MTRLRRSAFMLVYSFFGAPRLASRDVGAGTPGRTSDWETGVGCSLMVQHPRATPRRSGENTGQGGRPTDRHTPGGDPRPGDTNDLTIRSAIPMPIHTHSRNAGRSALIRRAACVSLRSVERPVWGKFPRLQVAGPDSPG